MPGTYHIKNIAILLICHLICSNDELRNVKKNMVLIELITKPRPHLHASQKPTIPTSSKFFSNICRIKKKHTMHAIIGNHQSIDYGIKKTFAKSHDNKTNISRVCGNKKKLVSMHKGSIVPNLTSLCLKYWFIGY